MGEDDDLLADDDVGSKNELEQAKKEAAARADLHRKQRQQEENLDPEEIERYYRRMCVSPLKIPLRMSHMAC